MLTKNKIRVFLVDDSLVFDRFLSEKLPQVQSRIEVVGYAMNARDAMTKIRQLKPDVVTMDVEMPYMNGIEFLKKFLPTHPLPVILVSSLNVGVFDALSYGAVDFVRKPDMTAENTNSIFVNNLASKILIASNAKVKIPAGGSAKPASATVAPNGNRNRNIARPVSGASLNLNGGNSLRLNSTIIALGASTGGTEATLQVMKQLPANTPGMVITQHMPKGFTEMYAERLNRLCKMEVKEAAEGDVIRRGRAFIAPGGDLQMKVVRRGTNYVIRLYPGDKVNGHRPSVDVLFQSVAQEAKGNAVGIILTGMGRDGASGLLEMRRAGAYTIGQDKDSCVVYGMPMVAQDIGAVCTQAACSAIPGILIRHLNSL